MAKKITTLESLGDKLEFLDNKMGNQFSQLSQKIDHHTHSAEKRIDLLQESIEDLAAATAAGFEDVMQRIEAVKDDTLELRNDVTRIEDKLDTMTPDYKFVRLEKRVIKLEKEKAH